MPTLEHEKQICDWVKPHKKASLAYRKHPLIGTVTHECDENNDEQSVWDLVRALRMKAATPQVFRKWTEEDLKIFAEEDELDPERAQRLATFLQTE